MVGRVGGQQASFAVAQSVWGALGSLWGWCLRHGQRVPGGLGYWGFGALEPWSLGSKGTADLPSPHACVDAGGLTMVWFNFASWQSRMDMTRELPLPLVVYGVRSLVHHQSDLRRRGCEPWAPAPTSTAKVLPCISMT